MANKTISELNAATLSDDLAMVVEGATETQKTTVADLKQYIGGGSDYTAGFNINITDAKQIETLTGYRGLYEQSKAYTLGDICRQADFNSLVGICIKEDPAGEYNFNDSTYWAWLNDTPWSVMVGAKNEGTTYLVGVQVLPDDVYGSLPQSVYGTFGGEIAPRVDNTTGKLTLPGGIEGYYTSSEVDAKIAASAGSGFAYKGTVNSESDLPASGNKQGDIWNVADTGANYAWTGTEWDKLSETIDLSGYLTKTEAQSTYATTSALAGKQNSLTETQLAAVNSGITAGKVESYDTYKDRITALEGATVDAYTKEEVDGKLALKANSADLGTMAAKNAADYPTTAEMNAALEGKANNATTLAGYGITDAYTKTESDAKYLSSSSLDGKQDVSNLVTSLSAESTDTQYPSAKCVYDMIGNIETLLSQI